MRLFYGTLDHLSSAQFEDSVEHFILFAHNHGIATANELAMHA